MKYAPFISSEYECVKDDLEGPKLMHSVMNLRLEREECNRKIHGHKISGPKFTEFRMQIERKMLSMIDSRPKGVERGNMLASRARDLRSKIANQGLTASVYTELFFMYGGFNAEEFRKDFGEYVHTENEKLRDKSMISNKNRVESIDENLKEIFHKDDDLIEKHFRFVPEAFRNKVVNASFTKREMAEFILHSFVSDYKTRSMGFAVPVTIYGVIIASMPDKQRRIWQNIYESLGIKDLKKVARYRPRKSGLKLDPKREDNEQKIPSLFVKQG